MTKIDLNSDVGEGFGSWVIGNGVDEQMISLISSANVATGFHAGDPNIMQNTVVLAKQHGVALGAHPGFNDLQGFGRRHLNASPQELTNDMLYQLGALREFACLHGLCLQHIKPHGALYMHLSNDEAAASHFVRTLHSYDPELMVFCTHGSALWHQAMKYQQPVVCEFYADRAYANNGFIVFTRSGDLLDPQKVAQRVLRACLEQRVRTVDGKDISVSFSSICLHSDTPGAVSLLQAIVEQLQQENIRIAAPSAG